jgi:hypothetical protein
MKLLMPLVLLPLVIESTHWVEPQLGQKGTLESSRW